MTIGFIGAGNMGGAIAIAAAKAVGGGCLRIADANAEKAATLAVQIGATVVDNATVAAQCDYIFLGVKPQMMAELMGEIAPVLEHRQSRFILVSMAAGLTIARIRELAGSDYPVIRIMPNTPALVGCGAAAYTASKEALAGDVEFAGAIFSAIGMAVQLPESSIDAVTALSGSGPAYVFEFIQALADGGVAEGLPRNIALQLAVQTVIGSAKMVAETGEHPTQLKDNVTSPGGTTSRALEVMAEHSFAGIVIKSVRAAAKRSRELGGNK